MKQAKLLEIDEGEGTLTLPFDGPPQLIEAIRRLSEKVQDKKTFHKKAIGKKFPSLTDIRFAGAPIYHKCNTGQVIDRDPSYAERNENETR